MEQGQRTGFKAPAFLRTNRSRRCARETEMRFRYPFLLGDTPFSYAAPEATPQFVLASDLDHTMVQNEDPNHEALFAFNREWVSSFGASSLLVFSTGRSPSLYSELWVSSLRHAGSQCEPVYMCDHSVMCQGFIIFILYLLAHCPDIHPDMLQTLEFQNDSATRSEKTSIHAPFAGTYSAADTAGPDLLCWDRDIRPDQGEL